MARSSMGQSERGIERARESFGDTTTNHSTNHSTNIWQGGPTFEPKKELLNQLTQYNRALMLGIESHRDGFGLYKELGGNLTYTQFVDVVEEYVCKFGKPPEYGGK